MRKFYTHLHDGLTIENALQQAMLEMISTPEIRTRLIGPASSGLGSTGISNIAEGLIASRNSLSRRHGEARSMLGCSKKDLGIAYAQRYLVYLNNRAPGERGSPAAATF